MRRRFHRPRFARAPFRRRRRVNWLPQIAQPFAGHFALGNPPDGALAQWSKSGTLQAPAIILLENPNNPFVSSASRFAVQEDEITYQRIVGTLRLGMYTQAVDEFDWNVDYGLILVKGEYDQSGNWTVNNADIPHPSPCVAPQDAAERWLFRNTVVFRDVIVTSSVSGYIQRPQNNCTDFLPPSGSFIDIKPRRKARYEDKLALIVAGSTSAPNADMALHDVFVTMNLRILTSKWG